MTAPATPALQQMDEVALQLARYLAATDGDDMLESALSRLDRYNADQWEVQSQIDYLVLRRQQMGQQIAACEDSIVCYLQGIGALPAPK